MSRVSNKKRGAGTLVLATSLSLVPLLARSAVAQEEDAVARGAEVYGAMCGRCHNPRSPLERSDRDWVTIVNHMRVRANLTGEQVRNVLAFLQATNIDPRERADLVAREVERPPAAARTAGGPPATDPEVIARGKTLVAEKACLGCHVIGRSGGRVGPTLNGVVKRRDADYVRRKIEDPTFDNETSMMPNFGLTEQQVEAIVAYLATLDGRLKG